MALQRQRFSDIPSDAIVLTESEALEYQLKLLKNWKDTKDTFGFKYGPWLLAGASFAAGLFINSHFRNKLRLLTYGQLSTYIPNCIAPGLISFLSHTEFVVKDVLLQKQGTCPICLEMRASAFQALFGCVFPSILAPLACFSMAHRYGTYNMPYITEEPRKVFQLAQRLFKPISRTLFGILLAQAALGSIVTYFEAKSVFTVNLKLEALEKRLEQNQ